MALDIEQIKKNYSLRKNNIVADDVLNYFEKILEEAGIYGYKNWEKGLVIDGPGVTRYWVTVTLMYFEDEMPEPEGGMRLKKYGCEVYYKKGTYAEPVRVIDDSDTTDQKSRKAGLKDIPIWVVQIKMPRRLIDNAIDDYVSLSTLEVTEDDIDIMSSMKEEATDPGALSATDPNVGGMDDTGGLGDALA